MQIISTIYILIESNENTNFKEHRICGEVVYLRNNRKQYNVVSLWESIKRQGRVTFYDTKKTIICSEGYNE